MKKMLEKLEAKIGKAGATYVGSSLSSITRILSHTETSGWQCKDLENENGKRIKYASYTDKDGDQRRALSLTAFLPGEKGGNGQESKGILISGEIHRKKKKAGHANLPITVISDAEKKICAQIMREISSTVKISNGNEKSLVSIKRTFLDRVMAQYIKDTWKIDFDFFDLISCLRDLSEQSYENKSLCMGCIIELSDEESPASGLKFPMDFIENKYGKRYKMFSDGYKTSYVMSSKGALLGFVDLEKEEQTVHNAHKHYPDWCEKMAKACGENRLGVVLTRQGDILVFHKSSLVFSRRLGGWKYWMHDYSIKLVSSATSARGASRKDVDRFIKKLYDVAIDISFRRSGALFVVLHNQNKASAIVKDVDMFNHSDRVAINRRFDEFIEKSMFKLSRTILNDLSSIDGAVVFNKTGTMVSYGSILKVDKRNPVKAEGSRSQAAEVASRHGIAIKVSSDGDISVYAKNNIFLEI